MLVVYLYLLIENLAQNVYNSIFMPETKKFLQYFLIDLFLKLAIGCQLFLLDVLVRVTIYSLESIFE